MMRALAVTLALVAASAAHAEAPRVLALVVGNNAGGATLPDLAYADDDALRMADLLREAGAHVEVLTRVDADTARVFGPREATAPTRAAWDAALARLADARVRSAAQGPVTLLLYYAGHGDAERGTGSLLLEDGALVHADVRAAVERVAATTSHVVLDACNAFFVVHARGAGGRAWATSDSAGRALTSSTTDVGLFLSTSAEAQVFEWSQLSGGIFSHALRSGLRGAADADLDGRVTYGELEAFVRLATEEITNPVYVPQVFTRPPARDDVLLDLAAVDDARRVALEEHGAPVRLTVRDANGTILVDVRPEPGFAPRVLLPEGALHLELVDARGVRSERPFRAAPDAAPPDTDPPLFATARGPSPLVEKLFARPFGPAAMKELAKRPPPDEVFGLTAAQEQRLLLYLRTMRDDAREQRATAAWTTAAITGTFAGGFLLAAGGLALRDELLSAGLSGATGAALAGLAAVEATGALGPASPAERLADEVLATPPAPGEPVAVRAARVVRAVETIEGAAAAAPGARTLTGVVGVAAGVIAAGLGAAAFAFPEAVRGTDPDVARTSGGGLVLLGGLSAGLGVIAWTTPTDAERLAALLRKDPESILEDAPGDTGPR